jgi:hypothetical protein
MKQFTIDLMHKWYAAGGELFNYYDLASSGWWGLASGTVERGLTDDNTMKWQAIKQIASEPSNVNITNNQPTHFSLYQNYPNPFNPTTTISYNLVKVETLDKVKVNVTVSLRVYDVLGREIAVLVNEEKPAGEYRVEFNASHLPSGVYFYRLSAGNYTATKKLVLMK